ncbi:hypothetical protein ATCC90586_006154 [Pythium insidiosum]|nr:hypothetical protein ATCC90586_006154 [Pythium insidiosum]
MSSAASGRRGYEAFGSFHTPSAAELFAGAAASAAPSPASFLPPVPRERCHLDLSTFSTDAKQLFTVDLQRWTYLNHGAFGGPTRYATQVASAWRAVADRQPLQFHDRQFFPYVVQSIQALARFVGVSQPQELVLLPNATAGLHAVLDSVVRAELRRPGTAPVAVCCLSTRYGAVNKMLQQLAAEARSAAHGRGLEVHEVPLSLADSLDAAAVTAQLAAGLDAIRREHATDCSLVVVDHVTSNTGVLLPVEQIVRACHARGVPVLVDGAHALLNLPLALDELRADYYVGNCHKWFASPRGAAFLHVRRAEVPLEPRVVSHGFFDGLQSAFMWQGLQDYSAWLALPQCIAFWEHQGVERCRSYMHALAQRAAEHLYAAWDMPEQLARDASHARHAMRLVLLPSRRLFGVDVNQPAGNSSADAKHIQDTLHHAHQIEVPVKCVEGRLYVRLSAHIYNELEDYDRLARAIAGG